MARYLGRLTGSASAYVSRARRSFGAFSDQTELTQVLCGAASCRAPEDVTNSLTAPARSTTPVPAPARSTTSSRPVYASCKPSARSCAPA